MQHISLYPVALQDFITIFESHGLLFDFSDSAKSSVFSTNPLPEDTALQIRALNLRCQTEGITPCKIPFGSSAFMTSFVSKLTAKLNARYLAFKDLLPALLALDRTRKSPSHHNFEHFLNLVRLSFLSMPTYALRSVIPSYCVTYRRDATNMALNLVQKCFHLLLNYPRLPLPIRGAILTSATSPIAACNSRSRWAASR
jgi:hypothetical protein